MNDNKSNNFKSYIELEENELQVLRIEEDTHARLMPGEALISEAQNVVMFAPMSDQTKALFGVLSVTNFKFSFVRSGVKPNEPCKYQQNLLLAEYEVCLSMIDSVYLIGDRGSKRKLQPGQNVSNRVKSLQIVCKNMRVFTFSFKHSTVDSGKNVANSLLHHAFPKRHQLLFAYDYKEEYYSGSYLANTIMFSHVRDWKREMERTKTKLWRITTINQHFHISSGLPQTVVVPSSVNEGQLSIAAEHFQNRFFPIWVWSAINGAALVRMAEIVPTITERTQENIMLENVRKSHPSKKQPDVLDLSKDCPNPKEIQSAYLRLRDLCTPETVRQFWVQDSKFLSLIENSKWFLYVSQCLKKSYYAALQLNDGVTVVLQEGEGQDMCAIVSSLTQLILDSHWRTINGFQSLIQKEWVALGHQFEKRLGHVVRSETDQSPLFLLFLDCIWQLLNQFPQAFEFSETYLTTLWDSAHITIFETFLFNSEHDRFLATKDGSNPLVPRSVWDWGEQFPDKERELFLNPLFNETFQSKLEPLCNVFNMEFWSQCYFRWIPLLEIPAGDVNVVNNEHHNPLIENRNVLSPETTVSDSHSGDESFNEDKNIIPSTLIEDELKLALNKEASAEELENAISSCKELVLESEQCSLERKWLVRHLIELRLRLQECVDAQVDPLHPRNIGSSVNNRVVLGHHLVLQPFLSVSAITNTKKIHCDHCSGTIWCMFQAWYKCSDCGYSCHYKCITDIVRVCAHLTATEKGNYITDICPEKGISYQKYQCAECKTPLTFTGSSWAEARLCDYDGNYYCTSCHWNSMAVIPARVIHNWDMEKRPVCQASAQLLKITVKQPLIHLEQMNPKLFNFIHELGVVKKLREDLSIMRRYLTVCRKATEQHLLWKLGERHHLIDTTYMYSLQDLVDIHTGDLPSFLQSITDLYIDHIKNDCEICFGQGHLCEICGNNEVIFPFEAGVIICDNCKAVFHKVCWTRKKETCPKCSRLKNKESCVEEKLGDTEEDEDNELGDINQ